MRRRPASPRRTWSLPVEDSTLRGAGLSRNKTLAIRDLAARTLDGTVPDRATARKTPDEELIERLVAVRGVGRWTAEMLLMFGLGRPDVFPVSDLGIRKGFQITYGMKRTAGPGHDAPPGEGVGAIPDHCVMVPLESGRAVGTAI